MADTDAATLRWGIKASLIGYINAMSDGSITLARGARRDADAFVFPAMSVSPDRLQFEGAVTLDGHDGMLHLTLADPALERSGAEWVLTIIDPDDPDARLTFAHIATLVNSATGMCAEGSVLTTDGADLFFGPYTAGTPIDDPVICR